MEKIIIIITQCSINDREYYTLNLWTALELDL